MSVQWATILGFVRQTQWLSRLLASVFCLLAGATHAFATVTVTATNNANTLAAAIAAGNSGITLTGTPTITGPGGAAASGSFTSTGSNLGIAGGIVLSTGKVSEIPATGVQTPGTFINTQFSGTATGSEYDINTFTFSFTPIPGVNRMSFASVFMSEEYNEYANNTPSFSDNFTMIINGGAYTNQNIATIPGTSIITDIDNVNLVDNAGFYRDNTVASPPLPDVVMDGATTRFINAFNVVPGTTYTVTIRIADFGDAQYDSAVFISTSTILNNPPSLDLNSLATASGTGFTNTWVQGVAPGAAIGSANVGIVDDGATISSATCTITNFVAGDTLTATSLPSGVTATYNSATGVLTVTGVATLAQYQTILQNVLYSSAATNPAGPAKSINVVVNDGVDNSNTAVAIINMATLSIAKSAAAPTVNLGANNTLTDANDRITYTYTVTNTGNVALTNVSPVDPGPKFNGINGTGTLGAFTPASVATLNAGASTTFTAIYTLSAADVVNGAGITNGVTNSATARGTSGTSTATSSPGSAATSILTVAGISLTKTVASITVAAGPNATIVDAGDTITFQYVVKNVGSVALTAAFPTDAGPKYNAINGTNALGAMSPAAGVNLAVGASQTFTATYVLSALDVNRSAGITNGVTNTANATAKNGATTINAPVANVATTITGVPSLTISKGAVLTDTPGKTASRADKDEIITYTYTITNNGNVTMQNVQVKDMHGTPAVQIANGAGGITTETLTVPGPLGAAASTNTTANDGIFNTLAPGATITLVYTHTVTQAEIDKG